MHGITRKVSFAGRIAAITALALLALSGVRVAAQPDHSASSGATLEGTWIVQVTQRNCATNAALGTFASLVTFARGGTIIETPGSVAFAPGQRTNGHGNWAHDGGRTYSQRTVALILFDTPANPPVSPGFLRGSQTITHTVELVDADHFTSAGGADFYDANGQLYRSGCSSAAGQRFK
jgi:hypothetical protein